MRASKYFFMKFSNYFLFFILFILFFLKILFYILVDLEFLPISLDGGDANYYHAFVMYSDESERAVNIWPVILKYFNDLGLYSREKISYILLFLNLIIIPILTTKISGISFKENQKNYLYFFLICLFYPSLYSFTFDVFRDVFMVFSFLLGCLIVKKTINSPNFLLFILFFILAIVVGFFLVGLRPYLGYSFLIALFLWKVKFTKKRIFLLFTFYLLILFVANYIGLLSKLTEYRSAFEEGNGSTLGLNFSNPIMFIPNFFLSILGQLFGLYITNPLAIILLLVEVAPFTFMLIYVVNNIRFADSFLRFLIIFFVIYLSIWVIGNDNLGTAVRLRMYNYFVIYICFFYILKIKHDSSSLQECFRK